MPEKSLNIKCFCTCSTLGSIWHTVCSLQTFVGGMNDLLFHQGIQSQRGTRYNGKAAEKKGMLIWKAHWAAEKDCVQSIGHPLTAVYTAARTSPRMKWAKEGESLDATFHGMGTQWILAEALSWRWEVYWCKVGQGPCRAHKSRGGQEALSEASKISGMMYINLSFKWSSHLGQDLEPRGWDIWGRFTMCAVPTLDSRSRSRYMVSEHQ